MIYRCYKCGAYSFYEKCNQCNDPQLYIPLSPEYYPEFQYTSKGLVSDIIFKKSEEEKNKSKMNAVLEKYSKLKSPYFVNFIHFIQNKDNEEGRYFSYFKKVLLNIGFSEIEEYTGLLEKLIYTTDFNFRFERFSKNIFKHIKENLESTLHSWISDCGDLFRYELPLLLYFIYSKNLFTESILYSGSHKSSVIFDLKSHSEVLELCEEIFLDIQTKKFQKTLENFNLNNYVTIFDVDNFNGYQFEDFLKMLFKAKGFLVKDTPKTRDQGADLFIEAFGERTVIQAKNYSDNVSNKAVQEVIAAKEFYSCDKAMVITNRYFTNSAKELAKKANVDLVDRDKLISLLEAYNYDVINNEFEAQI